MQIHKAGTTDFSATLDKLARRGEADLRQVRPAVEQILDDVRARGDQALVELTRRFESRELERVTLDASRCEAAAKRLDRSRREALAEAADRIRSFHERQTEPPFAYEQEGIELGQRVRPVRSAGVYAPGGKASYPSTVLMTAIPAAVAGVERIVLASPNPADEVLAAAFLAGVHQVINVGGAQAIAALAYGTESVQAVDKIVGPGNLYVACAKQLVFGTVDIDSIAGPSEILVVADEGARDDVVAADLLSQAEHDEAAYCLLVVENLAQAERIAAQVTHQLEELPRADIVRQAITNNGHAFVCQDRAQSLQTVNELAPEHLILALEDADGALEQVRAAGAIFLGYHTPEAAGDYAAGPSHVLPTGGAARFSSPLGVYDFLVRSSTIRYSPEAIRKQATLLQTLARMEGLEAHARAVSKRL